MSSWRKYTFGVLVGLAIAVVAPAQAKELPAPTGKAIITLSGMLGNTNQGNLGVVDWDLVQQLGMHELNTTTAFDKGIQKFRGVLARDVFEYFGLKATTIRAIALDDYAIDIPVEDFYKYDVLIAFELNGKRLRVRDKGPAWIVYPRDAHQELQDKMFDDRWVWQLIRVETK